MSKTTIDWTDYSWNPVSGCTPISPACDHCYARSIATRFKGTKAFPNGFDVTLHPERLEQPLHWRTPRRVFVCSAGDLFHDDVDEKYIAKVFAIMDLARQHTYQILTKRPERMLKLLTDEDFQFHVGWFQSQAIREFGLTEPKEIGPWPLKNVWLGVTAENQEMAAARIPLLLQVPAAVRFISVEPMLGPVDLGSLSWVSLPRSVHGDWPVGHHVMASPGIHRAYVNPHGAVSAHVGDGLLGIKPAEMDWCRRLDWVIAGGETGPGARPMHPDWVRGLRDQCQATGVPFFFKGWGEWLPRSQGDDPERLPQSFAAATPDDVLLNRPKEPINRVGKKSAGHLLDGQLWRQFPEARI